MRKLKEHFYGINGKAIPKDVIPFYGNLEHGDVIENTSGVTLMYIPIYNGYVICTDDFSVFLSNEEINEPWKKI